MTRFIMLSASKRFRKRESNSKAFIQFSWIFLFLVLFSSLAWSQGYTPSYNYRESRGFEITPFYGYQFGGKHSVYEGEININDAQNFGLSLNFEVPYKEGTQMEILWIMQKSNLYKRNYYTGISENLFGLYTHYIQVGGIYGLQQNNLLPFVSLAVGAVLFHPTSSRYSDEWFFSMSLGGGVKIYLNERLGIRLQARALFPIIWGGGGLWCGSGGCSVGIGGTSSIVQGDVTAGLIIRL